MAIIRRQANFLTEIDEPRRAQTQLPKRNNGVSARHLALDGPQRRPSVPRARRRLPQEAHLPEESVAPPVARGPRSNHRVHRVRRDVRLPRRPRGRVGLLDGPPRAGQAPGPAGAAEQAGEARVAWGGEPAQARRPRGGAAAARRRRRRERQQQQQRQYHHRHYRQRPPRRRRPSPPPRSDSRRWPRSRSTT